MAQTTRPRKRGQDDVRGLLIEVRLNRSLDDWVVEARNEGLTWRAMAARLEQESGLRITHEALRRWYGHRLVPRFVLRDAADDEARAS